MNKNWLFLVVVLGLSSVVSAGTMVAKVGEIEYETIDAAMAAWNGGTTLTLLADAQMTATKSFPSTDSARTLNLSTFTLTAPANKHAIQITKGGLSSTAYKLDIMADATNPGGITTSGNSYYALYYSNSSGKDRVGFRIYGGVFNGGAVYFRTPGNTSAGAGIIAGGTFNGAISMNRLNLTVSGGRFNGTFSASVDSTCRLYLRGGSFKSFPIQTWSADLPAKMVVGSTVGTAVTAAMINANPAAYPQFSGRYNYMNYSTNPPTPMYPLDWDGNYMWQPGKVPVHDAYVYVGSDSYYYIESTNNLPNRVSSFKASVAKTDITLGNKNTWATWLCITDAKVPLYSVNIPDAFGQTGVGHGLTIYEASDFSKTDYPGADGNTFFINREGNVAYTGTIGFDNCYNAVKTEVGFTNVYTAVLDKARLAASVVMNGTTNNYETTAAAVAAMKKTGASVSLIFYRDSSDDVTFSTAYASTVLTVELKEGATYTGTVSFGERYYVVRTEDQEHGRIVFTPSIKPEYASIVVSGSGETRYFEDSWDQFNAAVKAAKDGDTIKVLKNLVNLNLNSGDHYDIRGKVTLDLDGHSLGWSSSEGLRLTGDGTFKVVNGSVSAQYCAFYLETGAVTLELDGVTAKSSSTSSYYAKGPIAFAASSGCGKVVIDSGAFQGSGKKNFLNATPENTRIYGGTFQFDPTAMVCPGCAVTDNGDNTWTVSAAVLVTSDGEQICYASLAAAVQALKNGDRITILQNNSEHVSLPVGIERFTFDANGKDVSAGSITPAAGYQFYPNENGTCEYGRPTAVVGLSTYLSFFEAIDAAEDGGTVKLISDLAGERCLDKPITLDFGTNVFSGTVVVLTNATLSGVKGGIAIGATKAIEVAAGCTVTVIDGRYTVGEGGSLFAGEGMAVVQGGTFNFNPAIYVGEGFDVVDNGDGTYTVGVKVITDDAATNEATLVTKPQTATPDMTDTPSETKTKLNETITVGGGTTTAAKEIEKKTEVEGVRLTTTSNVVEEVVIPAGVQAVVDVAKAQAVSAGNESFTASVTSAEIIEVKVDVKVTPKKYEKPEDPAAKKGEVAFDLDPRATVKVMKDGEEVAKEENVPVTNEMIDKNQKITVEIFTGFVPATILHEDEFGNLIEAFSGSRISYDEATGIAKVQVSHFSGLTAYEKPFVAKIGTTKYESLADALAAVKGGETIELLCDLDETVDQVAPAVSFTLDLGAFNYVNSGKLTNNGNVTVAGKGGNAFSFAQVVNAEGCAIVLGYSGAVSSASFNGDLQAGVVGTPLTLTTSGFTARGERLFRITDGSVVTFSGNGFNLNLNKEVDCMTIENAAEEKNSWDADGKLNHIGTTVNITNVTDAVNGFKVYALYTNANSTNNIVDAALVRTEFINGYGGVFNVAKSHLEVDQTINLTGVLSIESSTATVSFVNIYAGYLAGYNGGRFTAKDSVIDGYDWPVTVGNTRDKSKYYEQGGDTNAVLTLVRSTLKSSEFTNRGKVRMDAFSQIVLAASGENALIGDYVDAGGLIEVDMTGATGALVKIIDVPDSVKKTLADYGKVVVLNGGDDAVVGVIDNDLYVGLAKVAVKNSEGAVVGRYLTLENAIDAAQEGQSLALEDDLTLDRKVEVTKSLSLDLAGHDLRGNLQSSETEKYLFVLNYAASGQVFEINGAEGSEIVNDTGAVCYGLVKLSPTCKAATVKVSNVSIHGEESATTSFTDDTDHGFVRDESTDVFDTISFSNVTVHTGNVILNGTYGNGKASANIHVQGGAYFGKQGFCFGGDETTVSVLDGVGLTTTGGVAVCALSNTLLVNSKVDMSSDDANNDAAVASGAATLTVSNTTIAAHGKATSAVSTESSGKVVIEDGTVIRLDGQVTLFAKAGSSSDPAAPGEIVVNGGAIQGGADVGGDNAHVILAGGTYRSQVVLREDDTKWVRITNDVTISVVDGGRFSYADKLLQPNFESARITADMTDATAQYYKLIDYTGSETKSIADYSMVELANGSEYSLVVADNDLYAMKSIEARTLYVDDDWTGLADGAVPIPGIVIGVNGFATIPAAVNAADIAAGAVTVLVAGGTYDDTVNLKNDHIKYTEGDETWYGRIHFIADGEVVMNGSFTAGNDSVKNLGDIQVTGFTFRNVCAAAYTGPVYMMNSSGIASNIVITGNTMVYTDSAIGAKAQPIYVNSGAVEDVTIADNTIIGADAYSISVGGAVGTIDDVRICGNLFQKSADIGLFGRVLTEGVVVSNNTFDASSSGYALWVRNMTDTASVGKITLADNAIVNGIKVVIGFRNKTAKADFILGSGNTVDGVEITGWAETAADKYLVYAKAAANNAIYYDTKLYLGDETAFMSAASAFNAATADGTIVLMNGASSVEVAKSSFDMGALLVGSGFKSMTQGMAYEYGGRTYCVGINALGTAAELMSVVQGVTTNVIAFGGAETIKGQFTVNQDLVLVTDDSAVNAAAFEGLAVASGKKLTIVEGSNLNGGTIANSGTLVLKGAGTIESSKTSVKDTVANAGTILFDGFVTDLTVAASSVKFTEESGSRLALTNGAMVVAGNLASSLAVDGASQLVAADVTLGAGQTIEIGFCPDRPLINAASVANAGGTILIDMTGATEEMYKLISATGASDYGNAVCSGEYIARKLGNDLYAIHLIGLTFAQTEGGTFTVSAGGEQIVSGTPVPAGDTVTIAFAPAAQWQADTAALQLRDATNGFYDVSYFTDVTLAGAKFAMPAQGTELTVAFKISDGYRADLLAAAKDQYVASSNSVETLRNNRLTDKETDAVLADVLNAYVPATNAIRYVYRPYEGDAVTNGLAAAFAAIEAKAKAASEAKPYDLVIANDFTRAPFADVVINDFGEVVAFTFEGIAYTNGVNAFSSFSAAADETSYVPFTTNVHVFGCQTIAAVPTMKYDWTLDLVTCEAESGVTNAAIVTVAKTAAEALVQIPAGLSAIVGEGAIVLSVTNGAAGAAAYKTNLENLIGANEVVVSYVNLEPERKSEKGPLGKQFVSQEVVVSEDVKPDEAGAIVLPGVDTDGKVTVDVKPQVTNDVVVAGKLKSREWDVVIVNETTNTLTVGAIAAKLNVLITNVTEVGKILTLENVIAGQKIKIDNNGHLEANVYATDSLEIRNAAINTLVGSYRAGGAIDITGEYGSLSNVVIDAADVLTLAGENVISGPVDFKSDITVFAAGSMIAWSVAGDNHAAMINFAEVAKSPAFGIHVDADQLAGSLCGEYVIASNATAAAGKNFSLMMNGAFIGKFAVNGEVLYTGAKAFSLFVNADGELVVKVSYGNFKVAFDAMGGEWSDGSSVTNTEVSYLTGYRLPSSAPVRKGFAFQGWYDGVTNGAVRIVSDGTPLRRYADHAIFAKWSIVDATFAGAFAGEVQDAHSVTNVKSAAVIAKSDFVIPDCQADGKTIVDVGRNAFRTVEAGGEYAGAVTGVRFGPFVTAVRPYAFYGQAVTNVIFTAAHDHLTGEKTVLQIQDRAFEGASITTVVFPAGGVYDLGQNAFSGISGLEHVYCYGDVRVRSWRLSPFRHVGEGLESGKKVKFHLKPSQAADVEFVRALTNGVDAACVMLDQEVLGTVKTDSFELYGDTMEVAFTVAEDAPWKTATVETTYLLFSGDLSDVVVGTGNVIRPTAVERMSDGSYKATFVKPATATGFFRICVGD